MSGPKWEQRQNEGSIENTSKGKPSQKVKTETVGEKSGDSHLDEVGGAERAEEIELAET